MKTLTTFSILILFSILSFEMHTGMGELQGRVFDSKTNEGIPFAPVVIEQNHIQKAVAQTDDSGNYTVKQLSPGVYDIRVQYLGYQSAVVSGFSIEADMISFLNFPMNISPVLSLPEVLVVSDKIIQADQTSTGSTFSRSELQHLTGRDAGNIASMTAGVSQRDAGRSLNLAGSGSNGTEYVVDGIRVRGAAGLPKGAIEQISIITGGLPAKYENASGGLLNIDQDAHSWLSDDYEFIHFPPAAPSLPAPPVPQQPYYYYNTEEYSRWVENEFKQVNAEALSTFSVDVDRASYSNIRRFIKDGMVPVPNSVRIEEMINYFDYRYNQPAGNDPFTVTMELGDCPWNSQHTLLMIGMQGKKMEMQEAPPSNLVFLIDVSGSMDEPDKLPLLKESFNLLIEQLRPNDHVAIVVYAGAAGLVLSSTPGNQKEKIYRALDHLEAGGSTAGAAGINLAYKIAKENFIEGGNNRIILATDGDFNVGVSSDGELESLIEKKRKDGIFLSVLGFGTGNIKDSKMELLADKGNGNYAYIDNLLEGKKVFVYELTGTLVTIAKDVKLQLEFNPAQVKAYRLVGYETRLLEAEDFNDDLKDAGEIGAGHTVTAFYEIIPAGSIEIFPSVDELKYQKKVAKQNADDREWVTVKVRYKQPEGDTSKLLVFPFVPPARENEASENFLFASSVAEFGMLLRDSKFKGEASYEDVIARSKKSCGEDENGYRHEFIQLAEKAELLMKKMNASKE